MTNASLLIVVFHLHLTAVLASEHGQDSLLSHKVLPDSNLAAFTVHSNVEGARVFVDSVFLGLTPLDNHPLKPGLHTLRCIHSNAESWLMPLMSETLMVAPRTHIERMFTFPTVHVIRSEPYGASVRFHDSIVGTTPCIVSTFSVKELVTLSKEGYEEETFPLTLHGGELSIRLRSVPGYPSGQSPLVATGQQSKNLLPVYLASGTTVLAGIAAAYFKIKADGGYNEYRISGDPASLDEVHRFDTISGTALLTSEIGLIVLSYILLSR